jgi:hypothetical protein
MPLSSQGTLRMSAIALAEVVVGNWYYGFDCIVCSKRFAVFDDKYAGKTQLKFCGGGHILVACPHCSSSRLYGADRVRQFEAS